MLKVISYITYMIMIGFVLAFLLLAWRDLTLLFRRPKGLGLGVGRVWAIGRTAILESWAARVWVLPILWFLVSLILTRLVQPHGDDERERIAIYLMVLMRSQEYLILIFLTILACFSLPRERERKTLVTTSSKPISRLEMYLGKVTGFVTLAALLLMTMGLMSYGFLMAADQVGKSRSWAKYERAKTDYEKGVPGVGPPPDGLRLDAQYGVLQAGNFVLAGEPMQIAGQVQYQKQDSGPEEVLRFVKGGSRERLVLRFPSVWWAPGHPPPYFFFRFAVYPMLPDGPLPDKVEMSVRAWADNNPSQTGIREHRIGLLPIGNGIYQTSWQPEPEGLFGTVQDYGKIHMEMTCETENIYVLIRDFRTPDEANVLAVDTDEAHGGPALAPMDPAKIFGFEKDDLQQIEGPSWKLQRVVSFDGMPRDQLMAYCALLEVGHFRFKSADIDGMQIPRNKDGTFTLSMYLDVDKTAYRPWPSVVAVVAYSQTSPDKPEIVTATVAEKRLTEVHLPASLLTSGEDMMIDLRSLTPGHWLAANNDSVRLDQAQSPFLWNLAKSEMVIFSEVTLMVVIAVAVSVRLGGPVALLLAAVFYLLGNLFSFIAQTALLGTNSILSQADVHDLSGNWAYTILSTIYNVILKFVLLIVNVLPDFRIFDPLGYIAQWRNMPLLALLSVFFNTIVFALPFIALAYLMSRKQELS